MVAHSARGDSFYSSGFGFLYDGFGSALAVYVFRQVRPDATASANAPAGLRPVVIRLGPIAGCCLGGHLPSLGSSDIFRVGATISAMSIRRRRIGRTMGRQRGSLAWCGLEPYWL